MKAALAFFSVVIVGLLGLLTADTLSGAPLAPPIAGTWSGGGHQLQVTGTLEGGFTISAASSWKVFGCPINAGDVLFRYVPKGGSSYDLTWIVVWATTTQGQEGVKCENTYEGPKTVTVTRSAAGALNLACVGSACSDTGALKLVASKPTKPPPPTTTPTPPGWTKLVLGYEIPRRYGLDENKDGLIDYYTTSAQIDPKWWTALITVRRPGGATCDPSATYAWKIGSYANAFESLGNCVFAFRRFPKLGDYRVTVTATNGDQKSIGEIWVKLQDFLIVGLGDSNGSGEGNPDVPGVARPLWEDFRCHRSAQSYQARTASAIEKASDRSSVTFVHLACSGASINQGLLAHYRGINDPGGVALPAQVAKMDELVGKRKPDAVIVSIGINDLGFGPLVAFCIEQNGCFARKGFDRAAPKKDLDEVIGDRIAALPGRYTAVAARLDKLGIPPKNVYLTEYPDSTRNSNGKFCDPLLNVVGHGSFSQTEADWAYDAVLVPLNAAVATAAKRHGWSLVAGAQQLFRRHGYCSADSWIVPLTTSLLRQGLFWKGLGAAKAGTLHADAAGHQIQARLVVAALKRTGLLK